MAQSQVMKLRSKQPASYECPNNMDYSQAPFVQGPPSPPGAGVQERTRPSAEPPPPPPSWVASAFAAAAALCVLLGQH
ncbi:hypothetical protein EJB05_51322 [Eragrostis curvula]|uniref:Uncharacterized protein n=1 Tax=Eragrostis curvula TaxID=38414 RepID=A0A5J9SW47_9POAL|nr:hypothetical protein EJB05_51322 [Eragrostis curvula]